MPFDPSKLAIGDILYSANLYDRGDEPPELTIIQRRVEKVLPDGARLLRVDNLNGVALFFGSDYTPCRSRREALEGLLGRTEAFVERRRRDLRRAEAARDVVEFALQDLEASNG